MRLIKLALISIVILFAVVTAMSLLLPSQVIISRAIDITSSKGEVYNLIKDTRQWPFWLENRDSLPVLSSPNNFTVGTTKALIVQVDSNQIKVNWQVDGGQILPAEFNFIETDGSSYVTLQWRFVQTVKWYPWEKFASIVSDKILGQFMEASLDNLKHLAETKQTRPGH